MRLRTTNMSSNINVNEMSEEATAQLVTLLTLAVNSSNSNVKTLLKQLLIAVSLTETLDQESVVNPFNALDDNMMAIGEELFKLRKQFDQYVAENRPRSISPINQFNAYVWSGRDDL